MDKIQQIADECVACGSCQRKCAFLRANGTPGEICQQFISDISSVDKITVYSCNLCGLCTIACPKSLETSEAFLSMRRMKVSGTSCPLPQHATICNYERVARSRLFSLHKIPYGCDTIFFPGCSLAASRPETTLSCFNHLKQQIPSLGIVLDCCFKSSHDLGRQDYFDEKFEKLVSRLTSKGVKKVITGCPSCLVTFRKYGVSIETVSLYQVLLDHPVQPGELAESVTFHDACVTRFDTTLHESVRGLITRLGGKVQEVENSKTAALCCGEGGAASFISPQLTESWRKQRKSDRAGDRVVTYCAGCSSKLAQEVDNNHLLDLCFDLKRVKKGSSSVTRAPLSYVKRIALKWKLQKKP